MICFERKFIFIHIPKCAGTAIELALFDKKSHNIKNLYGHPNPYQQDGLQHLKGYQIKQEISQQDFDSFFKFTFVRNPWDRVISNYHHFKVCEERGDHQISKNIKNFEEFVKKRLFNDGVVHLNKASDFIMDQNKNVLVNFIGRFENLENDFKVICDKIGLKNICLREHNRSNRDKDYTKYYSDETKEIVGNVYKEDIERFEYKF